MSQQPCRLLYLLVDGLPAAQRPLVEPSENVDVFTLTEATAAEALHKIFAADAVSVWSEIP